MAELSTRRGPVQLRYFRKAWRSVESVPAAPPRDGSEALSNHRGECGWAKLDDGKQRERDLTGEAKQGGGGHLAFDVLRAGPSEPEH